MSKADKNEKKKLLLIDGSSLIHRAFYALPLLSNAQGEYTNGVYGFMMMMNRMLRQDKPELAVICLDKSRVTFRNQIAADYKATRKETPAELRGQFELLKEVLPPFGIACEELVGYEADDLLGTLARMGARQGLQVEIFSGDKDVLQLVDKDIHVYLTKKGISETEHWDEEKVIGHYGLTPSQLIDLKALMGDASDNISGVPGVGEKTALKLLHQFGNIENMYQKIDEVENVKLRQKLIDNKEAAFRSRLLATICKEAPLAAPLEKYLYTGPDMERLLPLYKRLQFRALVKELEEQIGKQTRELNREQSLFPETWETQGQGAAGENSFAVLDQKTAGELIKKIRQAGKISLYLQWQGPPLQGDILACGIALPEGESYAFEKAAGNMEAVLAVLADVLSDPQISKLTIDSKEAILLLQEYDVKLKGIISDAALAAYLLDPAAASYGLEELCSIYNVPYAAVSGLAGAAQKAAALYPLCGELEQRIASYDMEKLYHDVELPLAAVLAKMEQNGIKVEKAKLEDYSVKLEAEAQRLMSEIYEAAGETFNINSTKQLAYVLFEKMQIPSLKKTKTGYSTDSEVLEELAVTYPIASKILEYRACTKMKSTYADGLRHLIDPQTGKIHTTFKQTVTATGRLSSVEPNLQNIPVRTELGRSFRQVFIPEKESNFLLAGDYNQIELRILAHITGDEKLRQAFYSKEDIHARTAAEVFGLDIKDVTADLRRQAKAVNFGIVYGISDYGLSRDLGISRAQAHDYIQKYFARYPGVALYQKEIIEQGREKGYVSTILGRRRYLPDLASSNFNLRSFAQRMAINTPIQGSAADIIKIAMVNIAGAMEEKGMRSKMLLQVHDELIFDMAPEEREILPLLVRELMEKAVELSVPVTIDMKVGINWYQMEKI